MTYIVFWVIAILVMAGLEYLTRTLPGVWRTIILLVAFAGFLMWLLKIVGVL